MYTKWFYDIHFIVTCTRLTSTQTILGYAVILELNGTFWFHMKYLLLVQGKENEILYCCKKWQRSQVDLIASASELSFNQEILL